MSRDKYFEHDIFSNSFLTMLKEKVKAKPLQRILKEDAHFLKFGREFEDALLYDKETDDLMIKSMVKKVRSNKVYQTIINHPKVRIQHEYYRRIYDLKFKCKVDLVIPGKLVPDIKSTNAKTYNTFLRSIMRFDYDRQIYIYMTMTKCPGLLIGCSKQKDPKVYLVSVQENDPLYLSGKRKAEELITILKAFL